MQKDNLANFRHYLPSELMENAISLENIHINEYIWKWRDALNVIDVLIQKRIFVLGGDVYSLVDNVFRPVHDNWYIDPSSIVPTDSDYLKSQNISRNFISLYVKRNGEEYYYSIVAKFPNT